MQNSKELPAYVKVFYLLPILLCVALTIMMVISYTKTTSPELDEETLRGKEILEQYNTDNDLDTSREENKIDKSVEGNN
ncbi:hypothetical protein GF339_16535 [candidate division KSB3 bacterium]|uniref:Uncharacterized protein n=1 Tax=candidate division KSB3 bacterium TaxID=2044937 RepID=A0A9D5JY92_9BACT|nr:hypothetical protein [candidate division KSB3 bacterium]MBD3326196.1 hypothetical protein [candidate division KSB3 bacterium]